MGCFRTGDPLTDFHRKDAEEAAWLDSRPKCYCCENPIQEENCFDFGDGLICEECMPYYVAENFKRSTENYINQ